MDLDALVQEFATAGIGERIYGAILGTVRAVVFGYRYPPSYSPTGRWDEDALTALAHDWAIGKLLRRGQLQQLLLINDDLRGFRKGLELSFRHFLIAQKKRTALDNLFRRAAAVLDRDGRFQLVQETGAQATRLWGLAGWQRREPFQGSDSELITAGFRLPEIPVIRYRPDAQKLSPVIHNQDLARFIAALLVQVRAPLSLEQMTLVFRFRFGLLEAAVVSLGAPVTTGARGQDLTWGDTIGDATPLDEDLLSRETAAAVLRELSPRQRLVLRAYARPDATLTSTAEVAGCSKSTVENELRRAMDVVRRNVGGLAEAEAVYAQLIEMLISGQNVGNGTA